LWRDIAYQLFLFPPSSWQYHGNESFHHSAGSTTGDLHQLFGEHIQKRLPDSKLPPLQPFIIIDGLDECHGEKEQLEIVQIICESVQHSTGLRWMIFSRPEPHIKRELERAEREGFCWIKEIRVDSPEMQRDVEDYLISEFKKIAMYHFKNTENENWPSRDALNKIIKAVAGLFIYAVTIVKFIRGGDPLDRFSMVIKAIDGVQTSPDSLNPISTIDDLYRGLIKRTPEATLPLTLDLLGMLIVCPSGLPLFHFSRLLDYGVPAIYDALLYLHSVIAVPSPGKIFQNSLHYFHASFPDFLLNISRANMFARSPTTYRSRLVELLLGVLSHNSAPKFAKTFKSLPEEILDKPSLAIALDILTFASKHVWQIWIQFSSPDRDFLRRTIGCFSFSCLRSVCATLPTAEFARFLTWLRKSVSGLVSLLLYKC
jgi:hypothetical protein